MKTNPRPTGRGFAFFNWAGSAPHLTAAAAEPASQGLGLPQTCATTGPSDFLDSHWEGKRLWNEN
ncbi:MAG: hypothetical protein V9H69_08975 [Anaerolineae bacterium]|jgi:hypothetical protein